MPKFRTGMVVPLTNTPLERVGTTGSRLGPVSEEQKDATRELLLYMWPFKELHHGVCVGWDEWVHFLVRELFGPYGFGVRGPQIHGWPPVNRKWVSKRALRGVDVLHKAKEYKARDRDIAWHSQGLIGGPKQWAEIYGSGAWYTMRQAAAMLRPVWFVRADGLVIPEWKSELNEKVKHESEKDAQDFLKGLHPLDHPDPLAGLPRYERFKVEIQGEWPPPEPPGLDEAFGAEPNFDPLDDAFGL